MFLNTTNLFFFVSILFLWDLERKFIKLAYKFINIHFTQEMQYSV